MKTKDGFDLVEFKGNQFEQKSTEYYRQNGVYVIESHIAYDRKFNVRVFFVSGENGDEYGQFKTLHEAMNKAVFVSMLSKDARRMFDE